MTTEALKDQSPLGDGEERTLTTLVLGVENYDDIIQGRQAAEISKLLVRYYENTIPPILRHRGRIDKFIDGAGIHATFGAPAPLPNAELAAVQAARSLRRAIIRFNKIEENPSFKFRIAVTTGEVSIGNIGNKDRLEYTVVGVPVTLAFRMLGLARDFATDILIDENTMRALGNKVRVAKPRFITVFKSFTDTETESDAFFPVIG